jgi:hypothetical protein
VDRYPRRDELVYMSHGSPGRQISRFSMRDGKTLFLFIFSDECMAVRADPKSVLRHVFSRTGWEWPQIEPEMERVAGELHASGVAFRDAVSNLLRIPFVAKFAMSRDLWDDITLPDYGP